MCANVSEQGERASARRSLLAPVLLDEFSWQSDPVPWSGSLGRADSTCSAGAQTVSLRLRFGPLEIPSGSGGRVVARQRLSLMSPFVSLVCAPLLRARVSMVTAERRANYPLGVVRNIRNLTNLALVSSQNSVDSLLPIAASRLKIQQGRAFMSSPAKP